MAGKILSMSDSKQHGEKTPTPDRSRQNQSMKKKRAFIRGEETLAEQTHRETDTP